MSVTTPGPASGKSDESRPLPGSFTRKATGLVREVPLSDILAFNGMSTGTIAVNWTISTFIVLSLFPRANLLLGFGISIVLSAFVWVTFALLGALMPRVGGDYTFNTRLLHPAVGLASNLCYVVAAVLFAGSTAWLASRFSFSASFALLGATLHSSWFTHAAVSVQDEGWTFAIAAGMIIFVSVLCLAGTKIAARVMAVFFWISLAGFGVALLILLFKTHTGFVNSLNHFAAPYTKSSHTYQNTVAAGTKAGLGGSGYSTTSTLGAIYFGFNAILFTMGSMYLGGEMRGAGRRNRQLIAVGATGLVNGLLLVFGIWIVLHSVGEGFIAAASAGHFATPVPAYPTLFAAISAGGGVASVIIAATFWCAIPGALFFLLVMAQRAPFAWAFDGLIPQWFAKVNARTHTPVISITVMGLLSIGTAAWATFSVGFVTVLSYGNLLGTVVVLTCCVGASLIAVTRPHLYRKSIADWRIGGIPVLPVTGTVSVAVCIFVGYLILRFNTQLGFKRLDAIVFPLATIAIAVSYYYVARAVQRRRGIDLDLVYKSIPPE